MVVSVEGIKVEVAEARTVEVVSIVSGVALGFVAIWIADEAYGEEEQGDSIELPET
jgi:hypothetical protein